MPDVTALAVAVPVRLGRARDRRRFHVTKTATCRACGEGIAYLREPGMWLHRFPLKMDARNVPGAVCSCGHAARP